MLYGAGTYWRIIEKYKVVNMFAAPTALRAIRKMDPTGELLRQHDVSSMRTMFVAGERADPDTVVSPSLPPSLPRSLSLSVCVCVFLSLPVPAILTPRASRLHLMQVHFENLSDIPVVDHWWQ
eukprot:COSAG03_NODE_9780_length_694_cov_0.838655_1_plen_122_part_10